MKKQLTVDYLLIINHMKVNRRCLKVLSTEFKEPLHGAEEVTEQGQRQKFKQGTTLFDDSKMLELFIYLFIWIGKMQELLINRND